MLCPKLHPFFTCSSLFNPFPSGFWPHHKTETAPIKVVNGTCLNSDASETSVLVLLDLSAALDTAFKVLIRLKSYLDDGDFFVSLSNCESE